MAAAIVVLAAGSAGAIDEEGCLFCHALDLRAPAPERDGRDLRVSEPLGRPHTALFCSDCHPDARRAPHAAEPGPAQCIGECHGQAAGSRDTHRGASYGGLSEAHRRLSSPDAPCRLCHNGADKAATPGTIVERCMGCHRTEDESEIRGVHARLAGGRVRGLCADCHRPHAPASARAGTTCDGPACHQAAGPGMRRLVGHKGRIAGGRATEAGVVIGFAVLGLIAGRRLSPRARPEGAAR